MRSSVTGFLLLLSLCFVAIYALPGRSDTTGQSAQLVTANNVERSIPHLPLAMTSTPNLQTNHARSLSRRQYRHDRDFGGGWTIHYQPSPLLLPIATAAAALTRLWGELRTQILAGQSFQQLGSGVYSATFGKVKVNFATVPSTFQLPMPVVSAMAEELRINAEAGATQMWKVLLTHTHGGTPVGIHVWIELVTDSVRGIVGSGDVVVPT